MFSHSSSYFLVKQCQLMMTSKYNQTIYCIIFSGLLCCFLFFDKYFVIFLLFIVFLFITTLTLVYNQRVQKNKIIPNDIATSCQIVKSFYVLCSKLAKNEKSERIKFFCLILFSFFSVFGEQVKPFSARMFKIVLILYSLVFIYKFD